MGEEKVHVPDRLEAKKWKFKFPKKNIFSQQFYFT